MTLRHVLLIGACVLMAGRVAAVDIQTTAGPSADLRRYPTFSFLEADPKAKGAIADAAVRERLRHLIAQHLSRRGYRPAPPGRAGELGVHFAGHVAPKQRVLMTGRPGPYSYNWGSAEAGGTSTLDYREGTLIVDLVDLSKGELLWRARILEVLTAGYSDGNWQKIDRALADAFSRLPPAR